MYELAMYTAVAVYICIKMLSNQKIHVTVTNFCLRITYYIYIKISIRVQKINVTDAEVNFALEVNADISFIFKVINLN